MFDDDEDLKSTFSLIDARIARLGHSAVASTDFFTSGGAAIAEQLAIEFLNFRRKASRYEFMTSDQLFGIASERGRTVTFPKAATDISEVAGVYVFASLMQSRILKVGQCSDRHRRIAKEHLRKGQGATESLLIDHCTRRCWDWPGCLRGEEIVALLFEMPASTAADRCIVETALTALLEPEMK